MDQSLPYNYLPFEDKGLNTAFPEGREFSDGSEVVHLSRAEWSRRYNLTKEMMQSRSHINKALIEVAAQHPLIDGNNKYAKQQKRVDNPYREYPIF